MTTTAIDAFRLQQLASSLWMSQSLYVTAELGIADAMGEDTLAGDDVAAEIGGDPGATERLLRALATLGVVDHHEDGRFALTDLGRLLRADVPESLRASVLLRGPAFRRAWGELATCVRTGDHAAKLLDGLDDPFAAFSDPAAQDGFNAAMAASTVQVAPAVMAAYDFGGFMSIVDVGGGYGTLLARIAADHPSTAMTVFDLPQCERGVVSPCAFVAGDFFLDPVPAGADAYVLKSVLHDWNDERAARILCAVRDAMRDDSRLLVIEPIVPAVLTTSAEHRAIVAADLNMLVSTGGRERTEVELDALLAGAGLRRTATIPTASNLAVIEAVPAAD
jgi:SAM-dependent methyltransferase